MSSPPPRSAKNHVEIGLKYARDVIAGKIVACQYVIQACKRQLDDLDARDAKGILRDFYVWDEDKAGRICRFIERLPHIKGPKASKGELIDLEPWQCFILTTVFGWRRIDTGGRRFRRAYTEVPRGNAKSTLSSAVGLYCMGSDGEEGADVYSAATTRDQAKIVWGDAYSMLKKRPDFAAKTGMVPNKHVILHPLSNSKFESLSREAGTMDGKNIHLAIIDELHAHAKRDVYDVIETATAKRFSSLIWVITTAGSDTSGICYEVRGYVLRVLSGVVPDDSQFGIVYTLDENDDWTEPANWVKANPNWGVSVMPDVFAQLAKKAMQVTSAQNNFKTKHLDLWVNADVQWMDMRAWDRCADPELDESDFTNEVCVASLDLATKTDIAAEGKLFTRYKTKWQPKACTEHDKPGHWGCKMCYPPDGEVEPHFYFFLDSFLPEAAVEDGRNASYSGWAKEGWLIVTPGDVLDFSVLKAHIVRDLETYNVREFPYDPWQSTQLAQELQDQHGASVIEVRATTMNFSAPMKELEALVLAQRFHHNGNPVLRWMVSNVVCHTDAKDNIYPRKEQPQNKIDGVVAAIMALSRATLLDDPYANRGFRQL